MELQTFLTLLILKLSILPYDSSCYYIPNDHQYKNFYKSLYKPKNLDVNGDININITIVDSFIPTLSMDMFLRNNYVPRSLKILQVPNNRINMIYADETIFGLEIFEASHNNISDLNNLNNFPNLIIIDLQYNSVTDIISNFFSLHKQLITFNLSHNRIRNLPNISIGTETMKDLDLSSNKLNNITLTFFENMPNLINLDLANNNISKVYSGYFRKLNSLRYLNVSHNNIMFLEISSFSGLSHLETLDMSSNKLISLPDNIFHNTGSLVNLYIRNNSLTMLEPEDLFHSTHLKKIDIDQNVMTCNMIAHILKSFNKLKVTVIHGSSFGNISLNGIKCMYDQEVIISNSDNENEIVKKVYADFKKSDLFNFFKNLDSSAIKDIPVALRGNNVNETILNILVNLTADIARSKKQENNNLFAVSNLYNPIQNLQVKEEKLNNKIMFTNVLLGCFLICFVMQLIFKCYIYWKPNQQQHQEHNELYDLN